ncbi:hypothetical protein BV898_19622 [Hypsibius exemplaris]|uniref:Metalloendopeptidase n=1 Tax=Hypsibius exemplaris TaxID=2072580 RepID=A0A9X6RP41_HYPEX|nr:hypothetical protein BV898_19622 [Hypsibius exemplaris]
MLNLSKLIEFYFVLRLPEELSRRSFEVTAFGFPYDFGSIMHGSTVAFSKDGFSWTIRPKKKWAQYETVMGQRNGLSQIDIGKINAMYKCPERGGAKPNQPLPPPPSLPTRAPIQPTKMSSSSSFITGFDDGDDNETTTARPPVRPSVRSTRRTTRPSVPNTEPPPNDPENIEDPETQAPRQRTTRPRRIGKGDGLTNCCSETVDCIKGNPAFRNRPQISSGRQPQ